MKLRLLTNDLRWSHWRNIPPKAKTKTPNFSYTTAIQKLQTLKQATASPFFIHWQDLGLNIAISQDEAQFWFAAMNKNAENPWAIPIAEIIENYYQEPDTYTNPLPLETLLAQWAANSSFGHHILSDYQLIPAYILFNTSDFVHYFYQRLKHREKYHHYNDLLETVFRLEILPYLGSAEKAAFRQAILPYLGSNNQETEYQWHLIGLAGLIGGLDDMLEAFLNKSQMEAIPKLRNYDDYLHLAAFGLSQPERVSFHVRSKKLKLSPEYARAWLAHTELAGLEWLGYCIARHSDKTAKKEMFRLFRSLQVPEAVLAILPLWNREKPYIEASNWLIEEAELVARTLAPLAFGTHPQAATMQKYLRYMRSMQQTAALEAALQGLDEASQAQFRTEILEFQQKEFPVFDETTTPKWLKDLLVDVKLPYKTFANWLDFQTLPDLKVDGYCLNYQQVRSLLAATAKYHHAVIARLKESILPQELAVFAWAVFESWIKNGADSRDLWAFRALAYLGNDELIPKIVLLLKQWPGEKAAYQFMSHTFEILRQMGTDRAFAHVEQVTQDKKRYEKTIRQKAEKTMRAIAKDRGLSIPELQDRVLSNCGLDENGSYIFDYGSRQFSLIIADNMQLLLSTENGQISKSLPKPKSGDNAALAAQADLKAIKSKLQAFVKKESLRLQLAMIQQRRWVWADFRKWLLQHPLMFHLLRRLLWASYDENGHLLQSFRIDDSKRLLNIHDVFVDMNDNDIIGILHPAELQAATLQSWGDILSDFEIIAPFPQLGHELIHLQAGETTGNEIHRFVSERIEHYLINSTLKKSGWRRDTQANDDNCYFSIYYPNAKTTAIIRYLAGKNLHHAFQSGIDACYFVEGNEHVPQVHRYTQANKIRLDAVHPVVLSETLRTLYAVFATKRR